MAAEVRRVEASQSPEAVSPTPANSTSVVPDRGFRELVFRDLWPAAGTWSRQSALSARTGIKPPAPHPQSPSRAPRVSAGLSIYVRRGSPGSLAMFAARRASFLVSGLAAALSFASEGWRLALVKVTALSRYL